MRKNFFTLFFAIAASVGTMFAWNSPEAVQIGGIWYYIGDFACVTAPKGSNPKYTGDIVIPPTVSYQGGNYKVTQIEWYAFAGCSEMTSITLPSTLTSIGQEAFQDCTGLTSITIPVAVDYVGNYPFSGCTNLKSVTWNAKKCEEGWRGYFGSNIETFIIGEGVEVITPGLCNSLFKLTSITIPNSVKKIGASAFSNSTGLKSITCEAITPPILKEDVFSNVNKAIPLYVPLGSLESYRDAEGWSDFTNRQPITASSTDVTTIQAEPTDNSVVIFWPTVTDATVYTIEIRKYEELIFTLSFNEIGQLLNISYAKYASKNGQPRTALQTSTGWKYTITGLDSGTEYKYTLIAKNGETELFNESKTFTTTGDAQGLEDVQGNNVQCTKIVHNGQIFILRGEKIYNAQGALVK